MKELIELAEANAVDIIIMQDLTFKKSEPAITIAKLKELLKVVKNNYSSDINKLQSLVVQQQKRISELEGKND